MKKRNLNFSLVLASQAISIFGGNLLNFVLLLFIVDFTQSAGTVGVFGAMSQIPVIFFGPVGGYLADRFPKKKLIIALDFLKALLGAVAILLFLTGTYAVWNLSLLSFLFIAIVTIFEPLLTTVVPEIVEKDDLVAANGAIQTINGGGFLVGALFSGILVAFMGTLHSVIAITVCFFISTMIDFFIKIPQKTAPTVSEQKQSIKANFKESVNYLRHEKPILLRTSLIFTVAAFLFIPLISVGLPYFVRISFGASQLEFGLSQGLAGVGMVLGGVLSAFLKKWLTMEKFYVWIVIMSILALSLAVVLNPSLISSLAFWVFNLLMMAVMFIVSLSDVMLQTAVQEHTPSHMLGKITALMLTVINVITPVGSLLMGMFLQHFSHHLTIFFIFLSVVTLLLGIISAKIIKH